ncbi:hypothetical protein TSUD_35870 [Trifolium subterraneum]|uniref:Uncharacterized protein n=1 Tax=Trifolium subterraneum TaxID=3900 RepID=A0A2Z6NUS1_TRISU|nr:hypothetical protein TSUD_35870 [Trifolium subterraneum]
MNSRVRVQNVTILAPTGSPNTDGIDPGYSELVYPEACEQLNERIFPDHFSDCYKLPDLIKSSSSRNRAAWLSW